MSQQTIRGGSLRGRGRTIEFIVRPHQAIPATPFSRLDMFEARFVRLMVSRSHAPLLRAASICINRLGNGWLYVSLAVLLPLTLGRRADHMMLCALLSGAIGCSFYSAVKKLTRRLRPCDRDQTLRVAEQVLDKYSFPSGHALSAAAVGTSFVLSLPPVLPLVVIVWLLIAWSRIALAHHYPSDVVAGGVAGVLIGLVVNGLIA